MTRFLVRGILEHWLPSSRGQWNLCIVEGGTQLEILAAARNHWQTQMVYVWVFKIAPTTTLTHDDQEAYSNPTPHVFTWAEFQTMTTQDFLLEDQIKLAREARQERINLFIFFFFF